MGVFTPLERGLYMNKYILLFNTKNNVRNKNNKSHTTCLYLNENTPNINNFLSKHCLNNDIIVDCLNKYLADELNRYMNGLLKPCVNVFADEDFMNRVYCLVFIYLSNPKYILGCKIGDKLYNYYYDYMLFLERVMKIADYKYFEKEILDYGFYHICNFVPSSINIKEIYNLIKDTMGIKQFIKIIYNCLNIYGVKNKQRAFKLLNQGKTITDKEVLQDFDFYIRSPLENHFKFYNSI